MSAGRRSCDSEMRVATFLCERCHRDTKAVCTVWQTHSRLLWCESCVKAEKSEGIQVARETCQQCHHKVEVTSDVSWSGRYSIWCLRCVQKKKRQLRQAEAQETRGDSLDVWGKQSNRMGTLLPSPAPEPLLNNRYRILMPIGRGGFGAVYKAEDISFANRVVAIKEMAPGPGSHALSMGAVFDRESRMLAGLRHTQLPHIYDYFILCGRYYLVMDYLEGQTLEQYAKQAPNGRLPLSMVLNYGIQLCDVLEYLHSRAPYPIVFRDLKPSNVILGTDGVLYLIDFGIARFFKLGQTHDTMGFVSPGYAAPEQYGGEQTTVRADIYSLGATLHRLLSGTSPAQRPFFFASLERLGETGWADIERLIFQMVSLSVESRPSCVVAIRDELLRIRALLPEVGEERVDGRARILANSLEGNFHSATTLYGPSVNITAICWSPDSKHVAVARYDGDILLWDISIGQVAKTVHTGSGQMNAIAWSPDGARLASVSNGTSIHIWSVETGLQQRAYQGHEQTVSAVCWSPCGKRIVSGDVAGTIHVWDVETGHALLSVPPKNTPVGVLAWSPDGRRIASGGGRYRGQWGRDHFSINVWDSMSAQMIIEYQEHSAAIRDLAWSNNGEMIASSDIGKRALRVWDPDTGKTLATCRGHSEFVHSLSWSAGVPATLASVDLSGQVCFWNAKTGGRLMTAYIPIERCTAWSPDAGKLAFTANDLSVRIWSAQ